MAKVSGPLMSMDARGKFAGALVFSNWKGRPTVRQLVTPSNPASAGQVAVRNHLRVTAAGQRFCSQTAMLATGSSALDIEKLKAASPSGQAWNGTLVKSIIGAGGLTYSTAQTAFLALTAPQKTAWDDAADALDFPIPAVVQKGTGNIAATALTSGNVFWHYVNGLNKLGLGDAVGVAPPVYA